MNKSKVNAFFLVIASFAPNAHAADGKARDASEFEKSIVHLLATKATPDPESPWNTQNADVSGFAGVVVGDNKILAPAALVSRSVYIQAQKLDDVTKIPLKVVFVDYEANLAVLTPAEGKLTGMVPLAIGDDVPLNTELWMVGIENGRQLQRASVKILEVTLRETVSGGMQLGAYLLTGQSRTLCRGEPLIHRNKLVGICLGVSENQPWALTSQAIRHFLNDRLEAEKYRGFPVLGLGLSLVKSPHLKKELKWPENTGGVRVSEVQEISPFADDVKVNDVLLAIDGRALDNRGFFRHPLWGPIPLKHYIASRYAGDKMNLRMARDGVVREVTRPVRRYNGQDNHIPGMTFEGGFPHLIIGGLVFRELGVDFLMSFGRDWIRNAPSHLLYEFYYKNKPQLARSRALVLSQVLGDAFNQGYDREALLLLEKVNGIAVANLDDLRLAAANRPLERNGEKFMVFDFDNGSQIVLPTKGMADAHRRIAKSYNIGTGQSFLDRINGD